jgi:ABC-type phosphate transport system substrate-binding protein
MVKDPNEKEIPMNRVVAGMIVVSLLAAGAVQAETLQIEGSTTVGPIADVFAEYFKSVYPDLSITVKKTGSGDGASECAQARSLVHSCRSSGAHRSLRMPWHTPLIP